LEIGFRRDGVEILMSRVKNEEVEMRYRKVIGYREEP
jgi:hypothetical protein